ncbi:MULTISPECIES: hypothetical protein [Mycolicibacterium]|jgi:hypothetical protein|uniref:Uncharacterized protein n=3 Tax=Mycolicibacterium TaxID=1866885 RepID=A0A378W9X8_9MYCO|nr:MULTISPECIES: hypothetical protein [Mycolicibacterium]KLI10075.1 hypothetical protein AA982_01670 [Mycolicibacterium senegalense]KLO53178.1 hypothetical protein ABW05_18450 [Mycolicibacterium senegalense]KMV15175.1 hypothetical protein ACT17_26330 [Mycolicibacterium conceptionense]MCV7337212.1 hypothetical protein [Mycolicibacterium senegalense]MCW1821232.1 hypothetical protein [Mycolicibacterium senegalense]
MTNPWGALDNAAANKNLYLDPAVIGTVNTVYERYEESLETLIKNSLDETTEYFGTAANPLAVLVQKLFEARGKELTDYATEQLSQSQAFIKTARDAAEAMRSSQND